MQCYGYEALCRTLIFLVKERVPGVAFDMLDAADVLDAYGIDSAAQLADLESIADAVGLSYQRAA